MRVYVDAIGLCGPGLPDWITGRAVLAGEVAYAPAEIRLAASELLPPAERRRMTDTVKLAIQVASEAMSSSRHPEPTDLMSVFASSGGDGATITAILEILASPEREVSPTRFHNSVHNAPSGYWSIATQSRGASTSLCGYDFSFSVGLLDAAAQVVLADGSVLLVSYDLPYPPALHRIRPIDTVFGMAMLLSPRPNADSLAGLDITFGRATSPTTTMTDPNLEALRVHNPAARSLPLLEMLAKTSEGKVLIPGVAQNHLAISILPLR